MDITKLHNLLNHSHSPYSNVKVAAILLTSKGEFEGVNVENAAFPSSICAERSAILHSISRYGKDQEFKELHVMTSLSKPLFPCGACLQVMTEFFPSSFPIYVHPFEGSPIKTTLGALIPQAPINLKKDIKN